MHDEKTQIETKITIPYQKNILFWKPNPSHIFNTLSI